MNLMQSLMLHSHSIQEFEIGYIQLSLLNFDVFDGVNPVTFKRHLCEEDSHKLYTKSNDKLFLLFPPLRRNLWTQWKGESSLNLGIYCPLCPAGFSAGIAFCGAGRGILRSRAGRASLVGTSVVGIP